MERQARGPSFSAAEGAALAAARGGRDGTGTRCADQWVVPPAQEMAVGSDFLRHGEEAASRPTTDDQCVCGCERLV